MKTLERKESDKINLHGKKTLDETLPDLSQHPIVLKKMKGAGEILEKHPIPGHLLRK